MESTNHTSQVVVFSVDNVEYAFPIGNVKEIIRFVEPQPTSTNYEWMRA